MLYIERVYLKNMRCFGEVELTFNLSNSVLPWTVILGDNATGKTALLRAIALGLCDESSAAGLMKESDEGYIQRGVDKPATIVIQLRRGRSGRKTYTVETTIEKVKTRRGSYERLRQKSGDRLNFPREEIFACAYGAGRGTAGTGDITGYALINSLYNLFNYSEGLQNPELTIRRLKKIHDQKQIRDLLKDLTHVQRIRMTEGGITVDGAWGRDMPLRDLADGYKSTLLWLTDFLGYAIAFDAQLQSPSDISGIVLIDELEQHLHPRWQESVVDDLRNAFQNVQFITTTHSPLIASSVGKTDSNSSVDNLYYLDLASNCEIVCEKLPPLRGMRIDQILASRAFDYLVTTESEVRDALREASYLAGKGNRRSPNEEKKYQELKSLIAKTSILKAESPVEREIQAEFLEFMRAKTSEAERQLSRRNNDD